jgi:hypothetical protein
MLENQRHMLEWRLREHDGHLSVHMRRRLPTDGAQISLRGHQRMHDWQWRLRGHLSEHAG